MQDEREALLKRMEFIDETVLQFIKNRTDFRRDEIIRSTGLYNVWVQATMQFECAEHIRQGAEEMKRGSK